MPEDPFRYFRTEARELLDALSSGVHALQREGSREGGAELLRHAHTLKGAARVVRQVRMAELAHSIEEVLAPLRGSAAPLPRDKAEAVLARLDELRGLLERLGEGSEERAAGGGAPSVEATLDMRALDAVLESAFEVVTQLERLASAPEGAAPPGALDRARASSRALLEQAAELRLQPLQFLFAALESAARDAAGVVGKRITFELRGGELRLDPHALGPVREALQHLVRNAVTHGIEPDAERARLGKGPGHVVVEAVRQGRGVAIFVADDGAGLDLDALRAAAVSRGDLTSERARALQPDEVVALAFSPGLSTDVCAGAVSGRGVGLDVARARIAELGGALTVQTERGKGTRFTASIPVSVFAQPMLVVEEDSGAYSVPLVAVLETRRVSAGDVASSGAGTWLPGPEGAVRFATLDGLFGRQATRQGPGSAVVLRGSQGPAAIGVRHIRGVEDVIARPVPELAGNLPLVAGFSVDASGRPRPVLVPDALAAAVHAARQAPAAELPARARPPPILVVDDSLTTRMLQQSVLEAAGFDVELAASGEEALARAFERPHSLFLVDIQMPGMTGFELLAKIRSESRLASTPVVLVTSLGDPGAKARGLELGAAAYVVKSEFDQEAFVALVRRLAR